MKGEAAVVRKTAVPLVLLSVCFALVYHHVIAKLVHDWLVDDNYSHGFFIPLIAGYLLWQRRDKLKAIDVCPSNLGIVVILFGLFLYIVGHLAAELFTMRFSMLVLIWGFVLFFAGWGIAKSVFVVVAYLIFMIPLPAILWYKIAFPLKLFATKMAALSISLIGIPVYREGNILHLANTTLQVVDACSGMRSLASLLALSSAFALITEGARLRKWVLFLSAIPIAIFVNVVRLTATAALAQMYGPEVAQGFLHEMSGIIVFLLGILLLYLIHKLVPEARTSVKDSG